MAGVLINMPSWAQKHKGWLIPDDLTGHELICVTAKIPNNKHYRAAFYGAIKALGQWWNWERDGTPQDRRATQVAAYWRDLLYQYLKIEPCPDPIEPCPECDEDQIIEDWIEEGGADEMFGCYFPFVGQVVAGLAVPASGWLLCDGRLVSKAQYPNLYAALAGRVAETGEEFSLPDFRNRVLMGAGGSILPDLLQTAGSETHTLTVAELPSHTHSVDEHSHVIPSHGHTVPAHDHVVPDHVHGLVAHTHGVVIPAHTHGIPGRQNSAAGAGSRFMISGGTGTQDDGIQTVSGGGASINTGNGGGGATNPNTVSPLMTDQQPTTATTETGQLETGVSSAGESSGTGDDMPFSVLNPVIAVDFFIFAGCEGC